MAALQPMSADEEVRRSSLTYARKGLVSCRCIDRCAADIGTENGINALRQLKLLSVVGTACREGVVGADAVFTVVTGVDSAIDLYADLDGSDVDNPGAAVSNCERLQVWQRATSKCGNLLGCPIRTKRKREASIVILGFDQVPGLAFEVALGEDDTDVFVSRQVNHAVMGTRKLDCGESEEEDCQLHCDRNRSC